MLDRTRPTFTGKMTAVHFTTHAALRVVPVVHTAGALSPLPHEGDSIAIETPMGRVEARVLASGEDGMTIDVKGARWKLSLVTPAEAELVVASYQEGSGATDWLVRGGG